MGKRIAAVLSELNAPVRRRLRELFGTPHEPKEVYGVLSEFLSLNGKLLRPALCVASCKAVGGRVADAVPAAAAIEMFHNFTLIHDDIEDDSRLRRGKPCLHIKHGLPLALNAGDGLFMMVWRETLRMNGPRREAAQTRLLSAFTKVLEGQAVELGWYQDENWDVDEKGYFAVVSGKTGALIAVSCEVGGLLGGADDRTCRALYDFGMGIGIGFQIVDDVLNIVGDEKTYGKEIGGDIEEGKRTLITIWALRMLPKAKKQKLAAILKKRKKTASDVRVAVSLLKESGAVEKAMSRAYATINVALSKLNNIPNKGGKDDLLALAEYITRRQK